MSTPTDTAEYKREPSSTWEKLSTKQKLVSLILSIGVPAAMITGIALAYESADKNTGAAGSKTVPTSEKTSLLINPAQARDSSAARPPVVKKIATTAEHQKEIEETTRARNLANRPWFVNPKVESLPVNDILLPIDELQEMTAKQVRYEEILALRKLGVSWEIIERLVNYTRIARIDKVAAGSNERPVKKDLSFALRGKTSIAEITGADFGFTTLPHEDAHTLAWTGIRGIDEAAATWFQYFVNEEIPPEPPQFMGCGLAPEEFDYDSAYYDFDRLSVWFELRTGDTLFAAMVEAYDQWAGHPLERKEKPMPINHLYGQLEAKYKIPKAELQKHFETPASFQCQ